MKWRYAADRYSRAKTFALIGVVETTVSHEPAIKTWFPFPTMLTIGGKYSLDPAQKSSCRYGNGLEYNVEHEEGAMSKESKGTEQLSIVHPDAAGLDIGAREIFACVRPGRSEEHVKVFGTFTPDLQHLADWLATNDVETVAMESTGVYWIPVCAA